MGERLGGEGGGGIVLKAIDLLLWSAKKQAELMGIPVYHFALGGFPP